MGGQAFFLKTVYTGSRRVGAAEYVEIIENFMEKYGGMKRVWAITSDKAASCLNARNDLRRSTSVLSELTIKVT